MTKKGLQGTNRAGCFWDVPLHDRVPVFFFCRLVVACD